MYLRKITLSVVAFVFLGLIGLHYAISHAVLVKGISELENQYTQEHINRAVSALTQRTQTLRALCRDWSTRDDIITMLSKHRSSLGSTNLDNERFSDLNINMMLIIDNKGHIVYGKALRFDDAKEIPLPRNLPENFINNTPLLLAPLNGKRTAGIYMLKEQPMLIAAWPITTSIRSSGPSGVLLLGEFLGERLTAQLSNLTQLPMTLTPVQQNSETNSGGTFAHVLSVQNPTAIHELDENTIAGYKLIEDITGKPALIMRVLTPRGMHAQAQRSILIYIVAMAIVGILSAVVILVLLEKKLLSKIAFIITNIEHITKSGRITVRLPVDEKRNDELSKLALSINHMLTALETSDKALMESEIKYRRVVERANDAIVITQERKLSYANPRLAAITGYSLAELQDSFLDIIIHPDDLAHTYEIYGKGERGEETPDIVTLNLQHKDGHTVPIEANIGFVIYRNKPAALIIIRDITERKQAEESLAAEKEHLSVTLRSIGEGVITTDMQMRITLMSKVAERLCGWSQEEAFGKELSDVFQIVREKTKEPCDQPLTKIVSQGVVVELINQTLLIAKDKSEHLIALTGTPLRANDGSVIGTVIVFSDISEKKRMEEDLLKMKRMESVTTLAGSIAHDFNNILAGVLGNLSLARELCGDKENLKTSIVEAEKASTRAKVLTQQLVTFSKGEAPIKKRAALSQIIHDSAEFAVRGSNIRCTYEIADDLWLAEVDQTQISQVIHNLTVNAKQAMPDGGNVTITAQNITLDKGNPAGLAQGRYVQLSIRDEGIGIPNENYELIFEPFFTTSTKRIGLGLSTAQSIIKKHYGQIMLQSELEEGTTFDVFLPAALDQSKTHIMHEEQIAFGKGSILALEDDETVRNMMGSTLRMLGYDISFALNGDEAIQQYKDAMRKGESFDLVIIDLNIHGGKGGKDTIRDLLDYDPYTKAIVSSGSTTDSVMSHYEDYGFLAAVKKPYKVAELSEAIQKVLTVD